LVVKLGVWGAKRAPLEDKVTEPDKKSEKGELTSELPKKTIKCGTPRAKGERSNVGDQICRTSQGVFGGQTK